MTYASQSTIKAPCKDERKYENKNVVAISLRNSALRWIKRVNVMLTKGSESKMIHCVSDVIPACVGSPPEESPSKLCFLILFILTLICFVANYELRGLIVTLNTRRYGIFSST